MKKLVLFICVLILIQSCNTKKKETDLDKMGLKGDVIFVMPDVWSSSDKNLEFDNNGNLIRTIDYFDYDNIITLTETSFIRDNSNKIIGENELMYSDDNDRHYYAMRKKYNYDNDKLSNITYENDYYDFIEKYKYEDDKLVEIILPVDMLEIFKEPIDILFIKAFPIVAFKMLPLLIYAFALVEDISIVFCSVLFVSVLFAVTFKLPVSL